MKTVILLTALGLASAASIVTAAPHGRGMERLRAADTNGDGLISRDEAKSLPRLAERFDEIDADKNGQLTADELRAMHAKHRNARFDTLDTNKDGMLSRDEFNARHPHRAQK